MRGEGGGTRGRRARGNGSGSRAHRLNHQHAAGAAGAANALHEGGGPLRSRVAGRQPCGARHVHGPLTGTVYPRAERSAAARSPRASPMPELALRSRFVRRRTAHARTTYGAPRGARARARIERVRPPCSTFRFRVPCFGRGVLKGWLETQRHTCREACSPARCSPACRASQASRRRSPRWLEGACERADHAVMYLPFASAGGLTDSPTQWQLCLYPRGSVGRRTGNSRLLLLAQRPVAGALAQRVVASDAR